MTTTTRKGAMMPTTLTLTSDEAETLGRAVECYARKVEQEREEAHAARAAGNEFARDRETRALVEARNLVAAIAQLKGEAVAA